MSLPPRYFLPRAVVASSLLAYRLTERNKSLSEL